MSSQRKIREASDFAAGTKKDSVTGLSLEVYGRLFKSDRVYDYTDIVKSGSAYPDVLKAELEFEIGKNLLILTSRTQRPVTGEGAFDGGFVNRQVYSGKFKYNESGRLVGLTVTEWLSWSRSIINGDQTEFGNVRRGRVRSNEFPMDGGARWTANTQEVFSFIVDEGVSRDQPKNNLFTFSNSKYFENGWWDSPFSANLI